MLRSAACVAAIALVTAGGASAEVVARGVQDGFLALDAKGVPSVAWVRNSTLFVADAPRGRTAGRERRRPRFRRARARWRSRSAPPGRSRSSRAATTARSSSSAGARSAGRRSGSRRSARSSGSAGPASRSTARASPVIGYTRWNAPTLKSRLLVSRVDAKGRISTRRITQEGFPKSLVPPPAAPLLFGDVVHVVESYGYRGRARHDRVVPFEEGLDRARARRGARRLPGRAGLRRSQPERGHARRLDRVAALVRPRGGARDARRAAALRELGVRARPRADERARATGDRARGRGQPVDQRERPRSRRRREPLGRDDRPRPEQGRAGRLDLRATRSPRAAGATCCWAARTGCAGSTCPGG